MKAWRVHAWGQAPVLEERPDPQPRPGHTLVRTAAATVAHVDRTVMKGGFLSPPPLPYTPGVEAAGVVVQSERFAPGTRVWLRGGGLGTRRDGTWCVLIDAPDDAIGLLLDGVDMALGSAFFSPCTSAWVALRHVADLQPGERVGVTGASGAVGSITAQLARAWGATVVDAPSPDSPVDLLVDTVGGPVLEQSLDAVSPGGRIVLVGYTAGEQVGLSLPLLMQRDVRLLPLNMYRREAQGRAAAPQLLELLRAGALTLATQRFALEQAPAALAWIAQRGHRGRAVLAFD
ncbi:zinc-binding alcohol dehydrogenase family protein [Pseudacidovorax sp. RU35E]|uniref:quinone oxidoreductase family protein n=1 Tax=Pseudacidovorax sp. RU35E TaxID=1907403 RepID=UPI000956EFED|nr:zinc-binding alcohol dehydrogenase family protein [Pseudacidovorax sp. RU35E]SIR50232.1 NADPH2:quinone reductase [Pseudacidovorax sp. RU35E]